MKFFIFFVPKGHTVIPVNKVKKVNFEERETTLEYCEAREGALGWAGIQGKSVIIKLIIVKD
jgi:hypothetical protein